jgi:hypothetical protein
VWVADCGFQIGKFVGRFCETPFIYLASAAAEPYKTNAMLC